MSEEITGEDAVGWKCMKFLKNSVACAKRIPCGQVW